jgi:hypothetical protein
VPVQAPVVAVSVSPSRGVPETVGGDVLCAASAATASVGAEVAGVSPPSLRAVTTTRSVAPTSSGPAV